MALALDGHAHANASSVALTTTSANDVIIAAFTVNSANPSGVTGGGLTWTLITDVGSGLLSAWYAIAPTALSAVTITGSGLGGATFVTIDVFGISGANTSSPFDGSGGSSASGSCTITTTNANDMIVGIVRANGALTADTGFTSISGANFQLSEFEIVSSTQSGLTIGAAAGSVTDSIAFAIKAAVPTPAANYDFPIPATRAAPIDLRTFVNPGGQKLLVGKDVFFDGAGRGPPPSYDLPPRAPVPAIDLRSWINPGGQPLLVSKDKFYGTFGQPPENTDWPLPNFYKQPQGPVSLKTWTDPSKIWLIGKDTIYGAPGEGVPNYDWPVPKTAIGTISLRTWTDATKTQLIGQDATRFNQYDWPVPRGATPATELKTWLQGYSLNLFTTIVVQNPFYLTDWPVPRGYTAAIDLRTWVQQTSPSVSPLPQGFNPDLSVPRGPIPGISLKTHVDVSRTWLIGQDFVPNGAGGANQFDWPVPRGNPPPIDLRTWLLGFNLNYDIPPVVTTFDWQLPRGPIPAITLRTWTDASKVWLIGQDQMFYGNRGPVYDYPNPRGPVGTIDLRTWLQGFSNTLGTVVVVFPATITFDYPNPRGATGSISLRTWIDPTKSQLIGQDTFFGGPGDGPGPYDYPNPRGPQGAADLRTWLGRGLNFQTIQAPFYMTDWPVPKTALGSISLRTHTDQTKINLIGKDTFFGGQGQGPTYDYPNPRGYVGTISLRSWTDPVKLELYGKDKFFGAAGQPPANMDWPVPKGAQRATDLLFMSVGVQGRFAPNSWQPLAPGRLLGGNRSPVVGATKPRVRILGYTPPPY